MKSYCSVCVDAHLDKSGSEILRQSHQLHLAHLVLLMEEPVKVKVLGSISAHLS